MLQGVLSELESSQADLALPEYAPTDHTYTIAMGDAVTGVSGSINIEDVQDNGDGQRKEDESQNFHMQDVLPNCYREFDHVVGVHHFSGSWLGLDGTKSGWLRDEAEVVEEEEEEIETGLCGSS
eukprot:scaffold284008_cov19-Tisochrysis_lutea.AAC.1